MVELQWNIVKKREYRVREKLTSGGIFLFGESAEDSRVDSGRDFGYGERFGPTPNDYTRRGQRVTPSLQTMNLGAGRRTMRLNPKNAEEDTVAILKPLRASIND